MKQAKQVQMKIRVTHDAHEWLQRQAEKQARSMNYIVMAIISERMKQEALPVTATRHN